MSNTIFSVDSTREYANGSVEIFTKNYKLVFEDKTANIYLLREDEENPEIMIIQQPWNPTPDGGREQWENEEQVIEWFKKDKNDAAD